MKCYCSVLPGLEIAAGQQSGLLPDQACFNIYFVDKTTIKMAG